MLSLIVAMDPNHVIGNHGRMPWHLPPDLRKFREVTMGKNLICGRVTWSEINKPLDGRRLFVLSKTLPQGATLIKHDEIVYCNSFDLALAVAGDDAIFMGGAQVYKQCFHLCKRLYVSALENEYPGDLKFPFDINLDVWELKSAEYCSGQGSNGSPFYFKIFERREKQSDPAESVSKAIVEPTAA